MFTGLVETLATVHRIAADGVGRTLSLTVPTLALEVKLGDSIAVNGVCLTVIQQDAATLAFQAGPETLRLTNLGELHVGDRVNLERSLRFGDRLGGHLVQGHVDGVGQIAERRQQGEWEFVAFHCPATLTAQMVTKGSITVDGVSLTLVEVEPERFSVMLIPHTLANTTLGFKPVGAKVNLETDILAKYVNKCLQAYGPR